MFDAGYDRAWRIVRVTFFFSAVRIDPFRRSTLNNIRGTATLFRELPEKNIIYRRSRAISYRYGP